MGRWVGVAFREEVCPPARPREPVLENPVVESGALRPDKGMPV